MTGRPPRTSPASSRGTSGYNAPMLDLIIAWVSTAVALAATASLLSGFQIRNGFKGALLVAAVLGLLNYLGQLFLYPIIGVATLTLGFILRPVTLWIILTLMLIVTDKVSDTLTIRNWSTAAIAAIGITIVTELMGRLAHAVF